MKYHDIYNVVVFHVENPNSLFNHNFYVICCPIGRISFTVAWPSDEGCEAHNLRLLI